MKIIILKNKKEAAKKAADFVAAQIRKKPSSVLGLPTGKTMIPIYAELVKRVRGGKISFENARTFNLDEYFGLSLPDKRSFNFFMKKNFLGKVGVRKSYFLDGSVRNWKKICSDYEKLIRKCGGIDLQILGIGVNGHIGFNEPGSSFKSKTRKIKLAESTRKRNETKCREALTVGIGTIMEARKIILVATGNSKSSAVCEFINGKITKKVPASVLQRHKNAIVLLDRDAAAKIQKFK